MGNVTFLAASLPQAQSTVFLGCLGTNSPEAPTSGLQPSPGLPYVEVTVTVLSSLLEQ